MFVRSTILAAATVGLLSAFSGTATAAPVTDVVDRSVFDATPELTAVSLRVHGPTSGPLGGAMDVTVRATDGTLPTTFGSCEPAQVTAQVTLRPGRVLTVHTRGEVCAHVGDGSLSANAGFRDRDVTASGFGHCRPRLVGDGLIAVSRSQIGGQASFFGTFRSARGLG